MPVKDLDGLLQVQHREWKTAGQILQPDCLLYPLFKFSCREGAHPAIAIQELPPQGNILEVSPYRAGGLQKLQREQAPVCLNIVHPGTSHHPGIFRQGAADVGKQIRQFSPADWIPRLAERADPGRLGIAKMEPDASILPEVTRKTTKGIFRDSWRQAGMP